LSQVADDVEAAVSGGSPPMFDPATAEVVLAPERAGKGYWVGAPSVAVDEDGHRVLLSYRRRRPRDGSRDERGYLSAIAQSTDGGRSFTDIWSLSKHEVGTSSLERFCLRKTAGEWLLYTSWEDPPSSGQWRVDVMAARRPEDFALASAQVVLLPGPLGVDAVKDPYVVTRGARTLMYVSTFLSPQGPAPTSVAASTDGFGFTWLGQALAVGRGWDAYQARLSSVVPLGAGFAGYYDGAGSPAEDTEERCGLAFSTDLSHWRRATERAPVLVSPHASGSLRYVDAVTIGGAAFVYFEFARPDGAHELRRQRL
jgi:hypothetical protein